MKKIIWVIILSLIFGFTALAEATLWDRGGGLIYDDMTDLTWLKDASYGGTKKWDDAITWAANLSFYDSVRDTTWDDWRLPAYYDPVNFKSELSDLYAQGVNTGNPSPFEYLQDFYWTDYASDSMALCFNFGNGGHGWLGKLSELNAWAVRDGDVGAASVPEPATGLLFLSLILGIVGMKRIGQRHEAFDDSVN